MRQRTAGIIIFIEVITDNFTNTESFCLRLRHQDHIPFLCLDGKTPEIADDIRPGASTQVIVGNSVITPQSIFILRY